MKSITNKLVLAAFLGLFLSTGTVFAEIIPTVRAGSFRSRIAEVQSALNQCTDVFLVVDGRWGSRTASAVRRFQRENGISPVGYVGRLTAEALNDCLDEDTTPFTGNYTHNSNSSYTTQYYNSNSNQSLCPNGMTLASNCTLPLFSTNNTNNYYNYNSGAEGTLVALNRLGSYNNTRVSAGDTDIRVLGVEVTARDGDQRIDGINVSFYNSSNLSNKRITRYISEVSIWLDGVKIGSKSASAYSDESNDTYTYRFTGMNGVVRRDQRSQIIVSVTAQNVIDSVDTDNDSWAVSLGNSTTAIGDGNFISAASANGRYRDYGSDSTGSTYTSNVDFQRAGGTSSDQRYRVTTASNSPVAQTLQVSRTSPTNGQLLLAFDVRAENSSMKVQRLPITLTANSTTGVVPNVEALVKTLYLYVNGTYVASESIPSGSSIQTVTFGQYSRLNQVVGANSTTRFEIRADLNDVESATGNVTTEFDEGDTIRADYTSANVSASVIELNNVNEDTVYNRSGSATGSDQTLRSLGVQVAMGGVSTTSTSNGSGDTLTRTITIPVNIRAFDETAFISQIAQNGITASGTSAVTFTFEDVLGATKSIPYSATLSSAGTPVQNGAFRIDPSTERQFILNIVLTGTAGHNTNLYRVQVNQVQTFADSSLTQGANPQTLNPANAFETTYYTLSLN